jgi:hypothetical protein
MELEARNLKVHWVPVFGQLPSPKLTGTDCGMASPAGVGQTADAMVVRVSTKLSFTGLRKGLRGLVTLTLRLPLPSCGDFPLPFSDR